MQNTFTFRDPVRLDGITSKFTRQETSLGYKVEKYQTNAGRFAFGGFSEDEDKAPIFAHRYSIEVLGYRIELNDRPEYALTESRWEIIAKTANQFIANPNSKTGHPEAWNFLCNNAKDLSDSKRYWAAYDHVQEIHKAEEKIKSLQEEVERAWHVASLNALGVREGLNFGFDERQKLLADFGYIPEER